MDFGIAETGIARGSPPGTTTEVLRFGVPFAEIRVVSAPTLFVSASSSRGHYARLKTRSDAEVMPLEGPIRRTREGGVNGSR
jgi:hypothetical protein